MTLPESSRRRSRSLWGGMCVLTIMISTAAVAGKPSEGQAASERPQVESTKAVFPTEFRLSGPPAMLRANRSFSMVASLDHRGYMGVLNVSSGQFSLLHTSFGAKGRLLAWKDDSELYYYSLAKRSVELVRFENGVVQRTTTALLDCPNCVALDYASGNGLFTATASSLTWHGQDVEPALIALDQGERQAISDVRAGPDAGVALTLLSDGTVEKWDFNTKRRLVLLTGLSVTRRTTPLLRFSTSGANAIIADYHGDRILVCDVSSRGCTAFKAGGAPLDAVFDDATEELKAIVNDRILLGGQKTLERVQLSVWRAKAAPVLECWAKYPSNGDKFIFAGALSADSAQAVVGLDSWASRLPAKGTQELLAPPSTGIGSISVAANRFAVGCADDVTRVFEATVPLREVKGGMLIASLQGDKHTWLLTAAFRRGSGVIHASEFHVSRATGDDEETYSIQQQGVVGAGFGKNHSEVYLCLAAGSIERWNLTDKRFTRDVDYSCRLPATATRGYDSGPFTTYQVDGRVRALVGLPGPRMVVFDLEKREAVHDISLTDTLGPHAAGSSILDLYASSDGGVIGCRCWDGVVLWSDGTLKDPWVVKFDTPQNVCMAAALAGNGQRLIVATEASLRVWHVGSDSPFSEFTLPTPSEVGSVTSNAEGVAILLGCSDQNAYVVTIKK